MYKIISIISYFVNNILFITRILSFLAHNVFCIELLISYFKIMQIKGLFCVLLIIVMINF